MAWRSPAKKYLAATLSQAEIDTFRTLPVDHDQKYTNAVPSRVHLEGL